MEKSDVSTLSRMSVVFTHTGINHILYTGHPKHCEVVSYSLHFPMQCWAVSDEHIFIFIGSFVFLLWRSVCSVLAVCNEAVFCYWVIGALFKGKKKFLTMTYMYILYFDQIYPTFLLSPSSPSRTSFPIPPYISFLITHWVALGLFPYIQIMGNLAVTTVLWTVDLYEPLLICSISFRLLSCLSSRPWPCSFSRLIYSC